MPLSDACRAACRLPMPFRYFRHTLHTRAMMPLLMPCRIMARHAAPAIMLPSALMPLADADCYYTTNTLLYADDALLDFRRRRC